MQEVNLLSDELRPRHDPFTLREFGIAWGLLVVLLALMSGWQVYTNRQINANAAAARADLAALTQEVSALESVTRKQPESLLVQQLAALTRERDDQKHLLRVLSNEPLNAGFVGHLRDLASISMRKLWFDTIQLENGGKQIRLAGFSERAELVPLYLSMLAEGSAFSGYSFDGLQIKRESDVLVAFEVTGPQAKTGK